MTIRPGTRERSGARADLHFANRVETDKLDGTCVAPRKVSLGQSSAAISLDIYADLFDDDFRGCRTPYGGENGRKQESGPLRSPERAADRRRKPLCTSAPSRARTYDLRIKSP